MDFRLLWMAWVVLVVAGSLAEHALLERVWRDSPCDANARRYPAPGFSRTPALKWMRYLGCILAFDPVLRRNRTNRWLHLVSWVSLAMTLAAGGVAVVYGVWKVL